MKFSFKFLLLLLLSINLVVATISFFLVPDRNGSYFLHSFIGSLYTILSLILLSILLLLTYLILSYFFKKIILNKRWFGAGVLLLILLTGITTIRFNTKSTYAYNVAALLECSDKKYYLITYLQPYTSLAVSDNGILLKNLDNVIYSNTLYPNGT